MIRAKLKYNTDKYGYNYDYRVVKAQETDTTDVIEMMESEFLEFQKVQATYDSMQRSLRVKSGEED